MIFLLALSACQQLPDKPLDHKQQDKPDSTTAKITFPKLAHNTISGTDATIKSDHNALVAVSETTSTPEQESTTHKTTPPEPDDLWLHFRDGLQLEYQGEPAVKRQITRYQKHTYMLEHSLERMRYYLFFVMEELKKQHVPYDVALLPIIESQYNPHASARGSVGMWQFMSITARHYQLHTNSWYDGRKDPVASSKAAAAYFHYLMKRFNNDLLLATAAYNAGEGTVSNAMRRNKRQGKPTDYWHLDLPRITKSYVPQMIALAEIFQHPEKYGLKLEPLENKPWFRPITIDNGINLDQVASILHVSQQEMHYLNAGIKTGTWPDTRQYTINIPVSTLPEGPELLAKAPRVAITLRTYHLIKTGESLGSIAQQYHVNISQLKYWNGLHSNTIIAGKKLLIKKALPVKSGSLASANGNNTKAQIHTVKSGESLWKIAHLYKVDISELAQWNHKSIDSQLKIGEKLIIHDVTQEY